MSATTEAVYTLPAELRTLRDQVRALAQERVAPRAAAIDADDEYPRDIRALLGEHDVYALAIGPEHGGTDTGMLMLALAIEELASASATVALMLMIQRLGTLPIERFGSEELKQRFLPKCATGEWTPAFCLSEPHAGSDPTAIRTTAVRDGDEWVLDGAKSWITNAGIADFYVVFAMTDPEARRLTAFVVEADRPGLSIARVEDKMGVRGLPTGLPLLEGVRVPHENVIGEVGRGMAVALGTIERGRLNAAAQAVGIAQGATDCAVDYAKERVAFDKPLIELPAIQAKLADMQTQTAAARELLYAACAKGDRSEPDLAQYASMAKLYASDAAMAVTTEAVQVLGGYGYVRDFPVERMMRDAKITQIYDGTNEILRMLIGRQLAR